MHIDGTTPVTFRPPDFPVVWTRVQCECTGTSRYPGGRPEGTLLTSTTSKPRRSGPRDTNGTGDGKTWGRDGRGSSGRVPTSLTGGSDTSAPGRRVDGDSVTHGVRFRWGTRFVGTGPVPRLGHYGLSHTSSEPFLSSGDPDLSDTPLPP